MLLAHPTDCDDHSSPKNAQNAPRGPFRIIKIISKIGVLKKSQICVVPQSKPIALSPCRHATMPPCHYAVMPPCPAQPQPSPAQPSPAQHSTAQHSTAQPRPPTTHPMPCRLLTIRDLFLSTQMAKHRSIRSRSSKG